MIVVASAVALGLAGQIDLRAHEEAPTGVVVGVDAQGVLMAQAASMAPSHLIGWDRVRRVGGVHGADAAPYEDVADQAWRARTRLERGDAVAAEPLFEGLFEAYAGSEGPLSVVVCEGLLRCRLRRGANVGAMEPWMALLDARSGEEPAGAIWVGDDWSSRAGLAPVLDESGLVPALPPMWLAWPSVQGLASSEASSWSTSSRARSLADLYLRAARHETGEEAGDAPATDQHWSVQLVSDIVVSRTGEERDRRAARERLRRRLDDRTDPWVEAWCRAAIGRSLVIESSSEARLTGVLELLHLPSRFREDQAYLAGLALAECVLVLDDLGDEASALTLARELSQGYRGHPVFDWPPLARYLSEHELASGGSAGARLASSRE